MSGYFFKPLVIYWLLEKGDVLLYNNISNIDILRVGILDVRMDVCVEFECRNKRKYMLILSICLFHYILEYGGLAILFKDFNVVCFALGALLSIIISYVFYFFTKVYLKYRNNNWKFINIFDSLIAWIFGGLYGYYIFFVVAFQIAYPNPHYIWGLFSGSLFGAIFGSVLGEKIFAILNSGTYNKSLHKIGKRSFFELAVLGFLLGTILSGIIFFTLGFQHQFLVALFILYPFSLFYIALLKIFDFVLNKYFSVSSKI